MTYSHRGVIYGLFDPDNKLLRYIGMTRRTAHDRVTAHMGQRTGPSARAYWFKSMHARGVRPELEIIEVVAVDDLSSAEAFWINYFTMIGCELYNSTESGSQGKHRKRFTDEEKLQIFLQ